MNETIESIANAVLYEGYMLYPYRRSAIKNRQRWNFGVVYPKAYSQKTNGAEPWIMQTECLAHATDSTEVNVTVRFLQCDAADQQADAVERRIALAPMRLCDISDKPLSHKFAFEPQLAGVVDVSAVRADADCFRLHVRISNLTDRRFSGRDDRNSVLGACFLSAHTILSLVEGEFVSLIDPPADVQTAAVACQNIGTWPVLAGENGSHTQMLSSPIILYDYPQVAPESPGDLFDGTEIDEILALRILTLSDNEKREIREGNDRAREVLERTESLPAEHFQKLHGALRGLKPAEDTTAQGVRDE